MSWTPAAALPLHRQQHTHLRFGLGALRTVVAHLVLAHRVRPARINTAVILTDISTTAVLVAAVRHGPRIVRGSRSLQHAVRGSLPYQTAPPVHGSAP